MKRTRRIQCFIPVLLALLLVSWCAPALAISITEEKKLAREFMKYISRRYQLIEDPTITEYVNRVGQKILATLPPQPFDYQFFIIKEDVYNAFAIPAGYIFIHSGLLSAMENEDELAGILGHEIAHVTNRHISRRIERSKKLNLATMAGMVAGIFIGAATGDSTAMQALSIGSAAAGQTAQLAYSREDEAQADQSGLEYIRKAGYDPEGLLSVLKKIRSKQWFGSQQIPTYMMTHPALEERIVWVDSWANLKPADGDAPEPRPTTASHNLITFRKVNIRLKALYGDPSIALQEFKQALEKSPEDQYLLYGYGLVLAETGKKAEAIHYLKKAQAKNALDPLILTDLGRLYHSAGRYHEAIDILEGAMSIAPDSPDAQFYLGRSYLGLDQPDKALATFLSLVEKKKTYTQAYHSLGETYGRQNDMPNAHYYLGLFYFKKREYKTARFHLVRAQRDLGDPVKLETIEKALKAIGPIKKETLMD